MQLTFLNGLDATMQIAADNNARKTETTTTTKPS